MRALAAGALLAAGVAGTAYLGIALTRTIAFGRQRARREAAALFTPPVTILKPLCGLEPGLFEHLSSFCDQAYPDFQVVFGVRDANDPAIAIAQRVIERFPDRDLSLVVDQRVRGANRKIANVLNMVPQAKHDILIVADSDISVDGSYLQCVVAPFADARVGAVTCLYRGTPSANERLQRGAGVAALGAMFVNEQFAPSVLVATALSPLDFCLGATMAVTRKALESIGGFEALAAHLADDQMLGKLVRSAGFRVELSTEVVESAVGDRDIRALWHHEVRWARTMHAARPLGFSFSFLTYALPIACAYALVSGNALAGTAIVGLALTLRLALHYAARSTLGVRSRDTAWLIPARDMLGLAVWAAHFFGKDVWWRDEQYEVDSSGRLRSLDPRGDEDC